MKESTVPEKREERAPATREEARTIAPPVDIFELPDSLAVIVDMPGVDREDVDVRVENDLLTIKGTPKSLLKGEQVYREYQLFEYFRQFELSEQIDQEKIVAELKSGILSINLPKAQKAIPKRITVSVN